MPLCVASHFNFYFCSILFDYFGRELTYTLSCMTTIIAFFLSFIQFRCLFILVTFSHLLLCENRVRLIIIEHAIYAMRNITQNDFKRYNYVKETKNANGVSFCLSCPLVLWIMNGQHSHMVIRLNRSNANWPNIQWSQLTQMLHIELINKSITCSQMSICTHTWNFHFTMYLCLFLVLCTNWGGNGWNWFWRT